jgi:hypothetical protein
MVYSDNTSEAMQGNNIAERAAQGVKLLGAGVVKVVHRCDDAKETKILDLSSCSLTQVPDAIYFLMRASDGKLINIVLNIRHNHFLFRTDH